MEEIISLGQELTQLEKPPNRVRFMGDLGESHQPKRHKILIHDTQQNPQEKHNKELRKSPKRRMGKTLHHLEEQHLTIYTYHDGLYKV
jgi:hypothetical protein